MMKKILVLDAHPNPESLCASLSQTYAQEAATSGHSVKVISLRNLNFDPILHQGYKKIQDLEPDLRQAQDAILWANHLTVIYPMWWGSTPALLKGFIDRVFLPSFAFKYHEQDPFWDKLLKGRSARLIVTSDAPYLYNFMAYFNAPYKVMKKCVFSFCGFKPVKVTAFGSLKSSTPQQREKLFNKVKKLAARGC